MLVDRIYHLSNVPLSILDHCKYLGVTWLAVKFEVEYKHVEEVVSSAN